MQLSTEQAPVLKNKMSSHCKIVDKSHYEKVLDESYSKKQKQLDKPELLHPEKEQCSLFVKTEHLEDKASHLPIAQPLPSIIVPETIGVDISDDADITVLGVYDKEVKGTNYANIVSQHTVAESVDIELVELVEHRKDNMTSVNKRMILGAKSENCNGTNDGEEIIDINSPSLLPPAALLLGKPKLSTVKTAENKEISKIDLLVDHSDEKNMDSSACGNIDVLRDITSPSLISPPEKKQKLCLNVTRCNKQETSNSVSSLLTISCNRNLSLNVEESLEDIDETYFPLPLTPHHKILQNEKLEEGFNGEVIEENEVSIVEDHMPEEKCPLTETQGAKNCDTKIVKPGFECSFDRLPEKFTIKYKFKEESVKKKDDRARLLGYPCKQCEEYYSLLDMPESEKAKRITNCSRHRAAYKPPATPEHYWELTLPDTPECKARGYVNETQMVQLLPRRRHPLALKKDK